MRKMMLEVPIKICPSDEISYREIKGYRATANFMIHHARYGLCYPEEWQITHILTKRSVCAGACFKRRSEALDAARFLEQTGDWSISSPKLDEELKQAVNRFVCVPTHCGGLHYGICIRERDRD